MSSSIQNLLGFLTAKVILETPAQSLRLGAEADFECLVYALSASGGVLLTLRMLTAVQRAAAAAEAAAT